MSEAWSSEEINAVIKDYVGMLLLELRGLEFNKRQRNTQLQTQLNGRSRGSVERKHQNISAVLIELGYPYINGYKPLGNYQALLRNSVERSLLDAPHLQDAVRETIEAPVLKPESILDILSARSPAPTGSELSSWLAASDEPPIERTLPKCDYLERETRNRELGLAGEEFIIRYEQERLSRAGKPGLAQRIEHVSKTRGDGFGYDILSFDDLGRNLLIEVKTTQFGDLIPFYASRNEIKVSERHSDSYCLYRVFNFRKEPKFFVLPGSLCSTCHCEPIMFNLRVK